MTTETVYFRGGRQMARQLAYRLVSMVTGREPDSLGIARGVFTAVGFAALSDIKADYVRKATGATGEDGVTWPPLSPKTLAYSRRFGPGEKAALKRGAGLGKAHRHAPGGQPGLLTAQQLKRWKGIYASRLARLMLSLPAGQAKARAAAIAWATVKREGARTMLDVYGSRKVDILRDTGVLLNSLSPGEISGTGPSVTYRPPDTDGGAQQVFALFASGVIVGTTVPYAAVHQEGDPAKGIPARPFLPTHGVPDIWSERWAAVGQQALTEGAKQLFLTAV